MAAVYCKLSPSETENGSAPFSTIYSGKRSTPKNKRHPFSKLISSLTNAE
jgi:hypothetical protein